jgi:hypothetical protein
MFHQPVPPGGEGVEEWWNDTTQPVVLTSQPPHTLPQPSLASTPRHADKLRLILSTLSDTHPLSDRPLLQKEIEAIIFHADADEQGYINYEALAHVIAAWPEDDLEDI